MHIVLCQSGKGNRVFTGLLYAASINQSLETPKIDRIHIHHQFRHTKDLTRYYNIHTQTNISHILSFRNIWHDKLSDLEIIIHITNNIHEGGKYLVIIYNISKGEKCLVGGTCVFHR